MKLKEKLKALGFEEVYEHGEYLKRDLDLYVYIRYNKIKRKKQRQTQKN